MYAIDLIGYEVSDPRGTVHGVVEDLEVAGRRICCGCRAERWCRWRWSRKCSRSAPHRGGGARGLFELKE